MDFGLILHEEKSFFAKVVTLGSEQGIFTRDRADEVIRVGLAMANKYVVEKEIDFRSAEELEKVQAIVLRLIGVGLELRSEGDVEEGLRLLMVESPVNLFRLTYTRVEKLRTRRRRLLTDHIVPILVTKDEFECMEDLTCRRLATMSVFTDSELYTLESITLSDEMFTSAGVVTYYEEETDRYEFVLELRKFLPFELLNKSVNVKAGLLAEVDSIREALVNTLVISGYLDAPDPVSLTMSDLRAFLAEVGEGLDQDPFSEKIEAVVVDIIQELGHGLEQKDATLFAREVIRISQKLMGMIATEWDVLNSTSDVTFFKRWSRMVVLSEGLNPLQRILTADEAIDELDLEVMITQLLHMSQADAEETISLIPWGHFSGEQLIRVFHELEHCHLQLASSVSLDQCNSEQIIEILEELDAESLDAFLRRVKPALQRLRFTMDELDCIAKLDVVDVWSLVRASGPVTGLTQQDYVSDFTASTQQRRAILFHSTVNADFFPSFFEEVAVAYPSFLRQEMKNISSADFGPFLEAANARQTPLTIGTDAKAPVLSFARSAVTNFFKKAPVAKKREAVKYFLHRRT